MTEFPALAYFFALAGLSMAFVGFTSVVVVLYQSTGKQLSPFHILLTRIFVELGIMSTGFAMLAPTISLFGLPVVEVWRISSMVMLLVMTPWLVFYPFRRRVAAPGEGLPVRWYVMNLIGLGTVMFLILNALPYGVTPGPAPLAIATVYVLSYAVVSYIGTYSLFTRAKS